MSMNGTPDTRAGETFDDLRKATFLDQFGGVSGVEPSCLSRALFRPLIQLPIDPKQENSYLAEDRLMGEPFHIVETAYWPFVHNVPH
jgi:hypothetical protein